MSYKKLNIPLVAIAVPVYNTEKYFKECLDHIVGQTYQNWICYITDNASTDTSYQIALEYEAKDSRFKVFRNKETVTAFENWNITLGRMSEVPADYMKYECADDWMFPECIERMVEILQKDDQVGVAFGYRLQDKYVDCDGLDINEGRIFDGKEILRRSMTDNLYISGGLGQGLYRVEALKNIDKDLQVINIQNIHCDVELNDKVMLNWKVGFVFQILTYYRRHEGQVLSFALKVNTDLYGNERRIYLHLNVFPELQKIYQELRMEYALYLLKSKKEKNAEILAWHKKYLERPITKEELKLAKKTMRRQLLKEIRMSIIKIIKV
ncbi:MAG: glycosyltransferase family 2 protein [Paludibacter sp.]|nr:glycosyltransferase family 2 protein [Paludibacter sp.]